MILYLQTEELITEKKIKIEIVKIRQKAFDERNYKIFVSDNKKKTGPDGIWQEAVDELARMFEYHELPVSVNTTRRLGHRWPKTQHGRKSRTLLDTLVKKLLSWAKDLARQCIGEYDDRNYDRDNRPQCLPDRADPQ